MRPIPWLSLFLAVAGCAAQDSQLATCQAEKEQLLATIRTQRETTRELNQQIASLETRLDQAEKQLAGGGSGATRLSSRPPSPVTPPPGTKAESLPWRAPPVKETKAAAAPAFGQRGSTSKATLFELARRERALNYDAASEAARLELPLEFRGNSAELSAADKTRLDEVSKLLRSEGARNLPVVVASASRGRAQAVADYLDRHGIPEQRLLVTAAPPRGIRTPADNVSLYLAANDSPLVADARTQAANY